MENAKLAEAISLAIDRQINAKLPKIRLGRFVDYESSDPGLCIVEIGTTVYRFVPMVDSANNQTSGDTVLLVGGENTPLVMVGVVLGNLSGASDGNSSPV